MFPSNDDKSNQEELYENWKLLAPYRKYDCIKVGNRIGEIAKEPSTFDEKILQVANLIFRDLGLNYVFIWAIEDNSLTLVAGVGEDIHLISKKREPNISSAGRVITNKKHIIEWDLTPDDEFPLFSSTPFPKTHSMIALPIISSDQIIAILELGSVIHCDFREDEVDTYQFIAWQIANFFQP